jgi:hypothetical protein
MRLFWHAPAVCGRALSHAALIGLALGALAPASALHAADGDLGRHKPSWWTDTALPALGRPLARERGEPVSRYNLTDDERMLRDLAYAYVDPPRERQVWERELAHHARARVIPNDWPRADRTLYFSTLSQAGYRSTSARYNRLIEDIEADRARIAPFFSLAERVRVMDVARERALPAIDQVTLDEHAHAMARVAENLMLHGWVHRRLGERVAAYRFALERLAISEPSPQVGAVELALVRLEDAIAQIRRIDTGGAQRIEAGGRQPWFPTTDKPETNLK